MEAFHHSPPMCKTDTILDVFAAFTVDKLTMYTPK